MRFITSRLFTPQWPRLECLRFQQQSLLRAASTSSSQHADFGAIDRKWQRIWGEEKAGRFVVDSGNDGKLCSNDTKYVLPMFPYPSGTLHMGHIRVYTISDVLSRYWRMQGKKVLHAIGWDAFGLPAENAANERGVDPAAWTMKNIEQMKGQLISMNGVWDWERELQTCDPSYYKHTQQIFLRLYKAGLAYQKEAMVNWDPVDLTVLANEQVDANGNSWRSGAKVEQRMLKQWFLATTHFVEELDADLAKLAENGAWPRRVVDMQKNWLGQSTGVRFSFCLAPPGALLPDPLKMGTAAENGSEHVVTGLQALEVYTTRLDTLPGVQFLAMSLKHPIVQQLAADDAELQHFINKAASLPLDSKEGYLLPIVATIGLLPGREIPIYVAPYVLDEYGTGAVMGVPAHDTRDHAFWRKHRGNEPVIQVVSPEEPTSATSEVAVVRDVAFTEKGYMYNTGFIDGLTSEQASSRLVEMLQQKGHQAKKEKKWRLRDWLISRQRYWGAPIPIVHCQTCGPVPVPDKDLPVKLPEISADQFRAGGGNPLERAEDWVNTKCPECGGPARRETDTMDTFMDSAWYFFRFLDPKNVDEPFDPALAKKLMPVDFYVGGVEHAILHLLYARFMAKFLASEKGGKVWDTDFAEPFRKLVTQGMVHGKTYSDPRTGRFLKPDEVDLLDGSSPQVKATGEIANISFEKMSKSKYNGVDPKTCLEHYGADVVRGHMLFAAPEGDTLEWEEERISGITRWLNKVWRLVGAHNGQLKGGATPEVDMSNLTKEEETLLLEKRKAITQVTGKLESAAGLNTVVSDLIKFTNAIDAFGKAAEGSNPNAFSLLATQNLVKLMAPLAPAFCEECWTVLHAPNTAASLFNGDLIWPSITLTSHESSGTAEDQAFKYVVSVNGKRKFECKALPSSMGERDLAGMQALLETEEGRVWAQREVNQEMIKKSKKVIVKFVKLQDEERGWWMVNFVGPVEKRKKKDNQGD